MHILDIYRKVIPVKLRYVIHAYKQKFITYLFLRKFNNYYNRKSDISPEEKQVQDFINKHKYIPVFPYRFTFEYNPSDIEVFFDDAINMYFVLYSDKRLYFKKSWSKEIVARNFNYLLIEQDERSPHFYTSEKFKVEYDDIIADVGAAEGIFALNHVQKASKIYLFENDPEWIEALQHTFSPWKEKVEIINKFVSDSNANESITLDVFFLNKHLDLIKIDVDGSEKKLLDGAIDFFRNRAGLKILICTYHKQDDYVEINKYFEAYSPVMSETSDGFMFFREDPVQKPPFIRRGLLRIKI